MKTWLAGQTERRATGLLSRAGSGAFLYFAAADASRADEHPAHVTVYLGADVLQVRIPSPLGLVVGVADVVADGRMLLAVGAMSHWDSDSIFMRFIRDSLPH